MKMTDGDPSPPYLIEPGTNVRLFSDYDGAERRLGESPLTSPPSSANLSLLEILCRCSHWCSRHLRLIDAPTCLLSFCMPGRGIYRVGPQAVNLVQVVKPLV